MLLLCYFTKGNLRGGPFITKEIFEHFAPGGRGAGVKSQNFLTFSDMFFISKGISFFMITFSNTLGFIMCRRYTFCKSIAILNPIIKKNIKDWTLISLLIT